MTNALTSNTVSTQNVVLWQYDKAEKFCALVSLIENLGKGATEEFWNYFITSVDNIDNADDFGLAVWGILLGVSRPSFSYVKPNETSASTQAMSKALYRRVLKAKMRLMTTVGSLFDAARYAADIFGEGQVTVTDNYDMSISYAKKSGVSFADVYEGTTVVITASELTNLFANLKDYWEFYPAAVRDNDAPVTRFLAFKSQYQADLEAQSSVVSQTTTKPNFFSSTDGSSISWKGVFHPAAKAWSFYDGNGTLLTTSYTMSYNSTTGKWSLGVGSETYTAQPGRATDVWREYGVYFPDADVLAMWM